ncbi:energy-coupling factor transporter ATPase [Sporomusa acidovorans]|uniref:Energy-coupling factor transporter ATP-binding protein EcfA2 n=1 Tax=Sporomusa acidovorans (strain ATCC 49682 / DSM 3132 / Mol) TaxID=1123286 RepID=A0ABZ3IX53_SPOA4|nr:energy-coupling factor transporter ATPase [Sporomusa acidovorans]OZC13943.1 energy-coupling factor transporter ATP-binding protein EcfA2 [Sporomusa acidovorans DSM 3132]SDF40147.1 energy-coupling factor transport system ATP-binding protein [Sporomusa acidovorans]
MSIIFDNVTYTYMPGTPYQRTAIQNINITINKGEFVGIIGHTGSGKSTLVQHMNGLIAPSSGKVTIDGIDLKMKDQAARNARRQVGMVFQYPEHQLFEETIYQDIAFGPKNLGLAAEQVDQRIRRAMEFVGLEFETFKDRSPFNLSGGQMRRVAIAGVIALEPDYLALDEPAAGLDPCGRDEIFGQIVKLHQETGSTVILVSHNMEDIARFASRVLVMNQGQIILDGPPKEIFSSGREKLQEAGVDVPPITALIDKLKAKGLPISNNAMTAEDAAAEIFKAVRGRSHAQ